MTTTREDLYQSALELSESERLLLVAELMDSVAGELPSWSMDDPALLRELDSRANDGACGIPWEEVQRQLRTDLQR